MLTRDSVKGIKESRGKIRWSLLPFDALKPVVRVLEYGATTKYQKDNWKKVPNKAPYPDAILRHWTDYLGGEEFDKDTKESHLASIVCNALFLIWDREKKKDMPFEKYLDELTWYDDYVAELDENKFEGVR